MLGIFVLHLNYANRIYDDIMRERSFMVIVIATKHSKEQVIVPRLRALYPDADFVFQKTSTLMNLEHLPARCIARRIR